jgi:hypothetical protein
MSQEVKVLIRDCEDNPVLIWDTLKMSFVQQRTAPRFNTYHALLSVEKLDSELLDSLINRVDEHIRVIKSLSPSSFTLDNLYDELAVMPIIRALPCSFDDIVKTISILDKFDNSTLYKSAMPPSLWGKALSSFIYVHNRVTTTALPGSTCHRQVFWCETLSDLTAKSNAIEMKRGLQVLYEAL